MFLISTAGNVLSTPQTMFLLHAADNDLLAHRWQCSCCMPQTMIFLHTAGNVPVACRRQ
jgi:hypothetical protein